MIDYYPEKLVVIKLIFICSAVVLHLCKIFVPCLHLSEQVHLVF